MNKRMKEKPKRMVVPLTKRGGLGREAEFRLTAKSEFHFKHTEL